ncbi:hypothetical protein [Thalassovita sp.]|uniref:hypothetical protein n=1 Tax=Thalassovita sp. TaxID=1979401 RepID=UPI002AB0BBD2|nr:hypothetical protein [Thalassovita sp.]
MKQSELISFLASELGSSEKTIKLIVRHLREAGLFTTGARGVNAPEMTVLDAVRIIVALLASSSPSRAPRDVKYFGNLRPDCRSERSNACVFMELDERKTLEETLLAFTAEPALNAGIVRISEDGSAHIRSDGGIQEYWQPEDTESFATSETAKRIGETVINRSAELPLEVLFDIGFAVSGGKN